jgi:dextranase
MGGNMRRIVKPFSIKIILIVLLLSACNFTNKNINLNPEAGISESGQWIDEVFVDKAKYAPGEQVVISTKVTNRTNQKVSGKLLFVMKHLDQQIGRIETDPVQLKSGESIVVTESWLPPESDYTGYLVEAWFIKENKLLDQLNTAVDVSSDWSRFPRYGYLTDFGDRPKEEIEAAIERLNRYHINGLQFYDWQYKHHQPLAGTVADPEEVWKDIANRDVYFKTVQDYIKEAHENNMMAMNYNLLFGSYYGSEKDGVKREWGLFKDAKHERQDGHPLPSIWATSKILLQNPANREWQEYLFQKEKDVFQVFQFDGWHVDQLGDRGRLYDYDGNIIDLSQTYSHFLLAAKEKLGVRLVMNAVNQYGQISIASAPVDFLYTEVWPPGVMNYGQLKTVIDFGNKLTRGEKNTILAAYMNYKKADRTGEFNKPSVLMTDAVIFASGGAHIELGDTGMLGKEYFPNDNLKMTPDLERELLDYYHFLVAYQNLLRDHVNEINRSVVSDKVKISDYPEKGAIWSFAKEKNSYEILHLINFTEQPSLDWRDDQGVYPEPSEIKDLDIKYYSDKPVEKVMLASPDLHHGTSIPLTFTSGRDEQGSYLAFTIPSIKYWDMIFFVEKQKEQGAD